MLGTPYGNPVNLYVRLHVAKIHQALNAASAPPCTILSISLICYIYITMLYAWWAGVRLSALDAVAFCMALPFHHHSLFLIIFARTRADSKFYYIRLAFVLLSRLCDAHETFCAVCLLEPVL